MNQLHEVKNILKPPVKLACAQHEGWGPSKRLQNKSEGPRDDLKSLDLSFCLCYDPKLVLGDEGCNNK